VNDNIEELPVRDLDDALRAVGGNADLARELFGTFLRGLEPQLQEIRQNHRSAQWETLKENAHRIHGGAAYCGVPALKAALKALEKAAAAGEPVEIAHRMEALELETERLFAVAETQG